MPRGVPNKKNADPFVDRMDTFANDLMDKAKDVEVGLQARTDVFKAICGYLAVKHRITDTDGAGESLVDLRRKLNAPQAPPRSGKARVPTPAIGGDPFTAAWNRRGIHYPDGQGGAALDAIKRKLPGADAGDDADAGDGD